MKQWDNSRGPARVITRYRTTLMVPATNESPLCAVVDSLECKILDQMPPDHRQVYPAAWYGAALTMRHTYRGVEWELTVDIEDWESLLTTPPAPEAAP